MTAKIDGFDFSEASAPQKKAPMKKPRRTKASVSSSAPSLQRKAKASKAKKKEKKAFATRAEQMLLAAVVEYGNNYQLAKLAGTTPDVLSRFARKERTLRLDTAGQVAEALGMLLLAFTHPLAQKGDTLAKADERAVERYKRDRPTF